VLQSRSRLPPLTPYVAHRGMPQFHGQIEGCVMLEAKAKDLALLRLQDDLQRLAPALAARLE